MIHTPLLPSVSAERAPVARDIVHRANRSLAALMAIPKALGLRPGLSADEWDARLALRDADSAEGTAVRKALSAAVALQDAKFYALGVELGHHYDSAIITADGTAFTPTLDDTLHYEMSTVPGSPLPHAWVVARGERVSTLDLVGNGRFTVLTGVGGAVWRERALTAAAHYGAAIEVVSIGSGCDVEDPYGYWAELREAQSDGCLLVRPDGHIAYRALNRAAHAPEELHHALSRALGHVPTTA